MVKTAKELSREDFEGFEFQPKKKVREMFEKLMTATTEEEEEEEEEDGKEEEEEEEEEKKNKKDATTTTTKKRKATTEKTNNNSLASPSSNLSTVMKMMRQISPTELACKLNSKHKDAEEKPTSSERILSRLLSISSATTTKSKKGEKKPPETVQVKKKKKTKEDKEPAAEAEEQEVGEEIDERLKLAREAMEAAKTSRKVHKIKDHGGLKAVIEKRDFAGMVMEVEKTYKEGSKEAKAAEEKENLKGQKMSGLDALIAKIEKSKKMSVLDKTKMDWKKVKDSNEEIDEELEMHRKSKNTYTEQQSFLQQAEYREYEKERDARLAANARRGPGI